MHRVMVNWYPLIPAGWEAGPNHHGHYGTGFSIFSCTQQPKNLHLKPIYFTVPKHTRYQSWVFLYISLPTKYTISGSILHYKVGLTLSFLSLISRGVGGIQKGNASIYTIARLSTGYFELQLSTQYITYIYTYVRMLKRSYSTVGSDISDFCLRSTLILIL